MDTGPQSTRPRIITVRWLLAVLLAVAVVVALNLAWGDGLLACPDGVSRDKAGCGPEHERFGD